MDKKDILLVNPNRLYPPVAPLGLEYIGTYLSYRGFKADILDTNMLDERQTDRAIEGYFSSTRVLAVGISIRNTDDSLYPSSTFLLEESRRITEEVRKHTAAPIVLGGAGFSIMPFSVMDFFDVEYGITGDGEEPLRQLLGALRAGRAPGKVPGLIRKSADRMVLENPGRHPVPEGTGRGFIDNRWYYEHGGQAGIETKRGCDGKCTYCADTLSKGNFVRTRRPGQVADELSALMDMGISHVHICDSEFNRPAGHAAAVCEEIIRRGLAGRLSLYAYCSPLPFTSELAVLMARAGFKGVDIGLDHTDRTILSSLGREHVPEDAEKTARVFKENGVSVMYDMLLGSPGETEDTLKAAVDFCRSGSADCIGVNLGVRVYPGTGIQRELTDRDRPYLTGGGELLRPVYYVAPYGERTAELLSGIIGDDRRFFFQPLGKKYNYNYASNRALSEAIAAGARGAYWDILRRL